MYNTMWRATKSVGWSDCFFSSLPHLSNPWVGCDAAGGEEGSSTLLLCSLHREGCPSQPGSQGGGNDGSITETSLTSLQTLLVTPATLYSITLWYLDLYMYLSTYFPFCEEGKELGGSVSSESPSLRPHCCGWFFWSGISPVASWLKPSPFTAGLLASRSSRRLKRREEQKQKSVKRERERNVQEQKLQQTAAGTTPGPCRAGKLVWTHKFCMDKR